MMINADGRDWPLDLFLDAYGFARLDKHLPEMPCFSGGDLPIDAAPVRIEAIDQCGRLIEARSDEIYWGDKIAWRAVDIAGPPAYCGACGHVRPEEAMLYEGMCENCSSEADADGE